MTSSSEKVVELLGDYKPMLDFVLEEMKKLQFQEELLCDHICFRVETEADYDKYKKIIGSFSTCVTETLVSGRNISIFKLQDPIQYKNLSIDCLELPAPKKGSFYQKGLEHAEFVLKDLNQFIEENKDTPFSFKAMNREINPELALKLGRGFQVKFHPLHILDVIKIEKEQDKKR
jgi:uncharacterized protein